MNNMIAPVFAGLEQKEYGDDPNRDHWARWRQHLQDQAACSSKEQHSASPAKPAKIEGALPRPPPDMAFTPVTDTQASLLFNAALLTPD